MSEIKPCPFCGKIPEVVIRDVEPQSDSWYSAKREMFVLCDCGCCLFDQCFHEGFGAGDECKANAVKAWNTRAEDPPGSAIQEFAEKIMSSADRIALLEYTFGHTHKRSEEGDLCKICGLDLRDQIHLRDIGSESKVAAKNDIERGGHGTEEYV